MPRTNTGPFDLSTSPIHLPSRVAPDAPAVPLPDFGFDGPSFEAYISEHCSDASPGRLVMIETSPTNWSAWECHPLGDELVIVLEGTGEFMQEIDGAIVRRPISPGATFVNPAGVWHTADVTTPMRAIYVTPCPGTVHRPR